MNRNVKNLVGYRLKETDGEIGNIEDFYFDDITWKIRYLVIRTGNWFTGRKVLISPKSLQKPDWEHEEFQVSLTKQQIKNSPDIDTEKPISRQQEEQLYSYYPWGTYWGNDPDEHGAGIFGAMPSDLYEDEIENSTSDIAVAEEKNDLHLRSTDNVTGYKIHATDGEIGKVVDYIIDDNNWQIKHLVVETGSWLDSRKVMLSVAYIEEVNWDNSLVVVTISTEEVNNSPEFDIDKVLNETFERSPYDLEQMAMALGLMFVLSFGLTCFGVVLASKVRSFEGFGVFSNTVILPLYFTSSSIFPLDPTLSRTQTATAYPEWLVFMVQINPITYAVDALRGTIIGFNQFPAWYGPAVIFAMAAIFFVWALIGFRRQ